MDESNGVVKVTNGQVGRGANTRVVVAKRGSPPDSVCATIESVTGAIVGFAQPGVAVHIRTAGGRTTALTLTNNVWATARWIWNGKLPFEMLAVRAMPDGFEVEFTMPVDKKSIENIASYKVSSFLYKHHPVYGSPPVNQKELAIKGVKLSEDGKKLRIVVDGLRKYYIHQLSLDGVRAANNYWSLVHPTAYYTLNNIPTETADIKAINDFVPFKNVPVKTETKKSTTVKTASKAAPSFNDIKPLLQKNTCLACHSVDKKVIGPSYKDVAKRKYSNEKIVELIYNPKPENWPGFATPMAPMPQVPKDEALKIARSLSQEELAGLVERWSRGDETWDDGDIEIQEN